MAPASVCAVAALSACAWAEVAALFAIVSCAEIAFLALLIAVVALVNTAALGYPGSVFGLPCQYFWKTSIRLTMYAWPCASTMASEDLRRSLYAWISAAARSPRCLAWLACSACHSASAVSTTSPNFLNGS